MFQKCLLFFCVFHQFVLFIVGVTGGTYLHLGELEGILPASPGGPLDAVGVGGVLTAQVLAVQVGGVAVSVPPRAVVEGGAVILRVVVVLVLGGELHPIVLQQRITCIAGIVADSQRISIIIRVHREEAYSKGTVLGICCAIFKVLQVDTQLIVPLDGQGMDLLQPEPVFTGDFAKSFTVRLPSSKEVDRAVLPALNHRPAASIGGHVAVDLEACWVVNRKYGVDAILSLTAGIQITAVTGA